MYIRNKPVTFFVLLFFLYYGVAVTLRNESISQGLVQSFVMCIFDLYLLNVEARKVIMISKIIVVITFIMSLLGFYVFFIYIIDPEKVSYHVLVSSQTGNSDLYISSYLDYLSFVSGDRLHFLNMPITRVKGYSVEPSASIVQYLAPVAFAMLYSKKYVLFGVVILCFSMIAISSLIAVLAIVLAVMIFIFFSLFKSNKFRFLTIIFSIVILSISMLYVDSVVKIILLFGEYLQESTTYNFIALKEESATVRLLDYSNSMKFIFRYPFGFSGEVSLTSLWVHLTLSGGIILVGIYSIIFYSTIKKSIYLFNDLDSVAKKYAMALIISISMTAFMMSSYGWDSIPGVIVLVLFYRLLLIKESVTGLQRTQHSYAI